VQWPRSVRLLLLATTLVAAGCVGVISEGSEHPEGTDKTSTTPAACTAIVPSAPLRRLTREQYNRTVHDLLHVDNDTPLVDDDVISGFEVGGNVAPLLAEQQVAAAEKLAALVVPSKILPCSPTTAGCSEQFVRAFGRRAFRRPLSAEETTRYLGLFASGPTFNDGVRLVIEAVLLSPRFHYLSDAPAGVGPGVFALTDHAMASRLSYFLWGSLPDDALLDAADAGTLHTPEQVASAARRMLKDPRAAAAIASFYRQWLHLDKLDGMSRDAKEYPTFTDAARASYRKSIEAFTMEATLAGPGGFEELLGGSHLHVDATLATVLGIPGVAGDKLVRVAANPEERAGLITHPAILAINSKSVGSDPIHRGIFVRTQLLCQELAPPPPDVDLDIEQPKPGLSTRDRFAAHTKNPSCASCHRLIDGIGFGLESYDALGRYRTMDQGVPVDARGELVSTEDADGAFVGGPALAKKLAKSAEVRRCVASKWTTFALARAIGEADKCGIQGLANAFTESKGDLSALLVAITELDAFRKVQVTP
jgi:hypothetical protein